ncbi:MAG TPA: DoxX family membrane protein [Chthonomonadaceae bacterium]|nr:DoxX family membrane protein [Chthonomonadaceae bacterium]
MSVMVSPDRGGLPRAAVTITPDFGTMGSCLALLRIFLGVKLLIAGIEKWRWVTQTGLGEKLGDWIHHKAPIYWYVPFLESSVLRHSHLFTWLVVFGEIILGIMLVFGLYTRLASFLAIVMLVNYMFLTWNLGFQWQGLNQALIAIALTCMITGAGRVFGLDVSNAFKNPKSIWW